MNTNKNFQRKRRRRPYGRLLVVILLSGLLAALLLPASPAINAGSDTLLAEPPQIAAQPDLALSALPARAYLPVVANHPAPAPLPPEESCALNAQEQEIADRMKNDPEQQRPALNCHPILHQVARERAEDMGIRAYFSHVNPDGYGPNYLVQQAGYLLPSWYNQAPDANNIESIAGGYPTAEAAWQAWMNSSGHRTHLLGLHSFWAEQTDYGIGYVYVPGSPYGHYWVVLTAKQGP